MIVEVHLHIFREECLGFIAKKKEIILFLDSLEQVILIISLSLGYKLFDGFDMLKLQ